MGEAHPGACTAERWVEAQSIITPDHVGEPIRGISASLVFDPRIQLQPCAATDGHGGWVGALVNLSAYDRRSGVAGELVQIGVVQGTWADAPLRFVHTADASNGGMIPLAAPYPEAGRSYTLSIVKRSDGWSMQITDAVSGRLLHEVTEPATWTTARSAWLMFEALDVASVVGTPSSAPEFAELKIVTSSGERALAAPACDSRSVTWTPEAGFTTADQSFGLVCGVTLEGGFRAFQRP